MIQPLIGNSLRSRVSEKKIKLHDIQPTESLGSSVTGKICLVCTVNLSSYCCPQCFIPYCSSQCYLRHGTDCTEAFSRQRVKAILDLEAKENINEPTADHFRKLQYGKFLAETDITLDKVSQVDFDRQGIDEDESDPDILDDESTDNNDKNLHADFEELGTTQSQCLFESAASLSTVSPVCRKVSWISICDLVLSLCSIIIKLIGFDPVMAPHAT